MSDIHQFTLGQLNCTVINDGNITIAPTSIFFEGASPDELAQALSEHGLSKEAMTIPCSILLVDTGDYRILVDCGSDGETSSYDADLGHLFAGLDSIDVSTDDISHVILSHGHFDHFAACADNEGVPRFANATYIMAKKEYDYWLGAYTAADFDSLMRQKLEGIKGQLQLLDADADILDGVRLISTPGHTYHHVSVEFDADGETLLCPIDTMDHYLQGQHPTWGANWDLDREAAIESRKKMLQRAADKHALVHGFHFPFPGLGKFSFDGTIWHWETME